MEENEQKAEAFATLEAKRYILAKPEYMAYYLADRRKNYPSRANMQRRRLEQQQKEHARILTDPTQPGHYRKHYQQSIHKGRVQLLKKYQASVIDKLIYHQQRQESSLLLEALQFIRDERFLQDRIPAEYLANYEVRPFEITFEAPRHLQRSDSTSTTSSSD